MSEYRFEDFDNYLKAYTEANELQLFTQDRESEVRSFKDNRHKYVLYQKENGTFSFHVWHHHKKQLVIEFEATPDSVAEYLDKNQQ
jgi:SRSO17 transposase